MAKKTPKTQTSTIEETTQTVKIEDTDKDVQKAAVNVDSKMSLQRLKSRLKSPRIPRKSPIFSREWQRESRALFPNLKSHLAEGKRSRQNTVVVLTVVVLFFVILFAIDYVLGGIFHVLITEDSQWAFIFIK